MADAGLNIVVGAQVSGAVTGLQQVASQLQTTAQAAGQTAPAVEGVAKSIQTIVQPTKDAGVTLNDLRAKLKDLQVQMNAASGNDIRTYAVQIKGVQDAIHEATTVVEPATESLEKFRVAFEDIGRVATGESFGLRSIATNFGLLGPEITIAAAALGFLYEKFKDGDTETAKQTANLEELKKALEDLKSDSDIVGKAAGGQAGDIERVNALADAVRNTNLSYKERNTALQELQETNKSYFGDLTLEASSLATLASRVSEYSQALIQEAIIKGYSEEISKNTIEYNKQSDALTILKTKLDAANAAKAKAGAIDVSGVAGGSQFGGTSQNQSAIIAAQNVDKANKAFEAQRNLVEQLGQGIASYKGKIDQAVESQLKLTPLKVAPVGTDKAAQDDNLNYLKQVQTILDDLDKNSNKPLFQKFQNVDQSGIGTAVSGSVEGGLAKINYEVYQAKLAKATADAAKGAITPDTFNQYAAALKAAFDKNSAPNLSSAVQKVTVNPEVSADVATYESTIAPKLNELLGKLPPIKTDIKVDPRLIFDKDFGTKANFEKYADTIESGFVSAVGGAITSASEAIGQLIANGDTGSFLSALGSVLGAALKAIGQAYISAATAVIVAKKAFQAFLVAQPELALLAGIGLEIAGSAIMASVNKTKAFATGGIVTGPTNALIGEAGPEVVFPLDQLNKFIKNGTGNSPSLNVIGETRLQGTDIITLFKRATKSQNLVS